jgi:hypothetical protein
MNIRAIDVYRAMVRQCSKDIAEAVPEARGRAVVDFVDFVMSDAPADAAAAIKGIFEEDQIAPWDEAWVLAEVARATLDAVGAWQSVAAVVLERLNHAHENDTVRELRERLSAAFPAELLHSASV